MGLGIAMIVAMLPFFLWMVIQAIEDFKEKDRRK